MERNITQHHPAIDSDKDFCNLNQWFIGNDYNDYLTFDIMTQTDILALRK